MADPSELTHRSAHEKPPSAAEAFDKFGRAVVNQDRLIVAALKTLSDRVGHLELVVWLDTAVLFVVGLQALHVW